jgi:phage terminase large subunit-like protein
MMMTCELNIHVARWLEMVEGGEIEACKDQHALAAHVRRCFETEDIYTDGELLERYIKLTKYFEIKRLFEWEAFCIALHLCTFRRETKKPRWPDLFLLIGRGAGKDVYIAITALCLISPHSGLRKYDVDICAFAEEQAMRPLNDILDVLNNTKYRAKMKKYFYWTKQMARGLKLQGVVKGRTNNPKSKEGMRSGLVVFNEIHTYTDEQNITTFVTGLGKKDHPRRLFATTNGDVREGPLDTRLAAASEILSGERSDEGLLPFICRLDDKKEADDPSCWVKANPSLPYLESLRDETEKEYREWKQNPLLANGFMSRRMNLPPAAADVAVTDFENIKATNRKIPDLTGRTCTVGIDYASVNDFASVNLHFVDGDTRYDINHSWLCLQSKDLHRINKEWRNWAEAGYLTPVDAREIHPDLLCEWLAEQAKKYNMKTIYLDNFRYALMKYALENIGFREGDSKNLRFVRPNDITKIQPVIASAFANQYFVWGDNPVLRWATNNTKIFVRSRDIGVDTGNFGYAKIEGKSRKTDPFMALVMSMTGESELRGGESFGDGIPGLMEY